MIRFRVVYLTMSLQVREDLHVYRKMCDTLDKVRKDLNGAVRDVGNGFFPIPPYSARPPGLALCLRSGALKLQKGRTAW